MLNINKASRTICNESCQKSQQLQFAEIRKMVFVDPAWNILTCASQNMDEEMSKLFAVKIIQTYTQLMKMQSETESQSSSSLSITVRRFLSFWTIPPGQFRVKNWKLLLACALVRVSCVCSLKKNSVDKKWSSSVAGRVFTLSFCHTVTLQ